MFDSYFSPWRVIGKIDEFMIQWRPSKSICCRIPCDQHLRNVWEERVSYPQRSTFDTHLFVDIESLYGFGSADGNVTTCCWKRGLDNISEIAMFSLLLFCLFSNLSFSCVFIFMFFVFSGPDRQKIGQAGARNWDCDGWQLGLRETDGLTGVDKKTRGNGKGARKSRRRRASGADGFGLFSGSHWYRWLWAVTGSLASFASQINEWPSELLTLPWAARDVQTLWQAIYKMWKHPKGLGCVLLLHAGCRLPGCFAAVVERGNVATGHQIVTKKKKTASLPIPVRVCITSKLHHLCAWTPVLWVRTSWLTSAPLVSLMLGNVKWSGNDGGTAAVKKREASWAVSPLPSALPAYPHPLRSLLRELDENVCSTL